MILNVTIDEKSYPIEVPEEAIAEGESFFQKMDSDMDQGWQISRDWVDNPDSQQRCQIAANKLLSAISSENEALVTLMVGYILSRMPGITSIIKSTNLLQ